MKSVRIEKAVNLNLLTEELFAAFPEWRRPDPLGRGWDVTDAVITADEVVFPDATDESAVQAVIDAHNPAGTSINQQKQIETQAARDELNKAPAWLKLSYADVETFIQNNTVGNVTRQQALNAVNNIASLNDVKNVLTGLVNAVYGLVEVNQKLARVLLAVIFYVKERL
jgi:hypothetical protein